MSGFGGLEKRTWLKVFVGLLFGVAVMLSANCLAILNCSRPCAYVFHLNVASGPVMLISLYLLSSAFWDVLRVVSRPPNWRGVESLAPSDLA